MLLLQDVPIATQHSTTVVSTIRAQRIACDGLANEADKRRWRHFAVWQIVRLWLRRRKDRSILRSMSPRDIHDFCLSQTDAETEMNKPFWRP